MLFLCWHNKWRTFCLRHWHWRWYCCSIFRTAWRLRLVLTMRRVACLTCDLTKRSPCIHTTTSSAAFRRCLSRAADDCCLADTTTSTVISGTHSNKTVLVCDSNRAISVSWLSDGQITNRILLSDLKSFCK